MLGMLWVLANLTFAGPIDMTISFRAFGGWQSDNLMPTA